MINKKNLLGKTPLELGDKDAIHVAIASVRAGAPVKPGERCKFNEFGEAIPGNGPGVADPFLKSNIATGDSFWMLLDLEEIPNVRHQWEHPTTSFAPPTRCVARNKYLEKYAAELGVTYEQLMKACLFVAENSTSAPYQGTLSEEALELALDGLESGDMWYEWSNETDYSFPEYGSACCPETEYPDTRLFRITQA